MTELVTTYWFLVALVLVAWPHHAGRDDAHEVGRARLDAITLKIPVLGDLIAHSDPRTGLPGPQLDDAGRRAVAGGHERDRRRPPTTPCGGDGSGAPARRCSRDRVCRRPGRTGLFPSAARQMFRVGEETGTLDEQLDRGRGVLQPGAGHQIKRFTALFEPAVIIFMGLVVGFVAVALVTAMYGIYSQVKVT